MLIPGTSPSTELCFSSSALSDAVRRRLVAWEGGVIERKLIFDFIEVSSFQALFCPEIKDGERGEGRILYVPRIVRESYLMFLVKMAGG